MKVERIVKGHLGLAPTASSLFVRLNAWNKVARPRSPLPHDLRMELEAYFAPDIKKLEILLERDLSCWLTEGK